MNPNDKIFIAGHRGLVGSAVVENLTSNGFKNLLLKNRSQVDLLSQSQVNNLYKNEKPDHCIIVAAKVGGIHANSTYIADFLYENLMIAANTIHAAHLFDVKKLLFLGSTCIYPKLSPQPIPESALLSGPLEPTNEGYAVAKIAGLKLCEMYQRQYKKTFISAMPTNLYGPGDNFHPENSHVIPGMLRKFHIAKTQGASTVTLWGTGTPKREFLHTNDLAEAIRLLMNVYEGPTTINIGSGEEVTICDLAHIIKDVTSFKGEIIFDKSKPDGTPRKVSDSSKLKALGWKPEITLFTGLKNAYAWAVENRSFA